MVRCAFFLAVVVALVSAARRDSKLESSVELSTQEMLSTEEPKDDIQKLQSNSMAEKKAWQRDINVLHDAEKKAAEKAKVKAVDSGKESPEEAKAEEKAAVKSGVISAEEAKMDEKKVDKATAADLIDIPDDDGILSLVQASQGMFLDGDNICVTASKGDQAPFNGQFNGREVASGTVAMESGTFCVDQSVLALVQRSWGLSSAQELEQVVKKKTKEEQEEAAKEEKKVDKKVAKAKGKEAKKKVVKEEEKKVEKAAKKNKKKKAVALVQHSLGLSTARELNRSAAIARMTMVNELKLEEEITKLKKETKEDNKKMKELIDSELNKKVGDLDAKMEKMEEQLKNLKVEAKTTAKVLRHLLDQHN